jgi:hypothetical protein
MNRVVAGWVLAMAITLPVAIVIDRRAHRAGTSGRRRAVMFVLTMVAAPLGTGLWLGLLHRPGRRVRL